MTRTFGILVICVLVSSVTTGIPAQGTRTSVSGLGAAGMGGSSRTRGLQQTGQLNSDAAITRDSGAFVGDSSGSFLTRSGSTGTGTGTRSLTSGMAGMSGMSGMGSMGMSSYGRGGMGGRNSGGYGSQYSNQRNTGRNGTTTQVRSQLRIAFDPTRPVATEISTRLQKRIPRIPGLERSAGVTVTMDGRTAVLQGVVASPTQRDLLARLALLEPGISDVRNELVVGSSPVEPGAPPMTPLNRP